MALKRSVIVAAVVIGLPLVSVAQTPAQAIYAAPRATDGHPDLQGVWGATFLTQMERAPTTKSLVAGPELSAQLEKDLRPDATSLDDPDITHFGAQALAVVRGEKRTSLVVQPADGVIPFTAAGQAIADAPSPGDPVNDDPEAQPMSLRCINGLIQAPIRTIPLYIPLQLVQTPTAIVMVMEDVGGPRIIHLAGDPPPDAVRTWDGYSAGRWEGETLVVETTHLRADDPLREHYGRPLLVGAGSRIIERFTRIADNELLYQFTIEDPTLYAAPWLAEYSFAREKTDSVYEYACHEANYSLVNALLVGRVRDGVR
jgi:hypothetical protein